PYGNDPPHDGRDRHREERSDDTADNGAGGQRDQDRERVQVHRTGHDDRLEQVALELVHGDRDDDDDERGQRSVRHERDQRGEGTRDDRTDERDESGEEDDHRERDRQGNLEDQKADPDADGIHRRDDRGAPSVPPEGEHGVAPDPLRAFVFLAVERAEKELPDHWAVLEEEEQHDDDEHEAGGNVRCRRHTLDRASADIAAGEEFGELVAPLLDLFVIDRDWKVADEFADLVDPFPRGLLEIIPLVDDRPTHQPRDESEHSQDGDEHDRRRERHGEVRRPESAHDRVEGTCEDQRDDHRNEHEPELHDE